MPKITKHKKMTRLESAGMRKDIVAHRQHGEGLYEYRNRTKGDLRLPKPAVNGAPNGYVAPGMTWEGDSYFMFMVPGDASLVRTIIDPNPKKRAVEVIVPEAPKAPEAKVADPDDVIILTEQAKRPIKAKKGSKTTMTEKLILDQPDQITEAGTVEHVVQPKEQQLHEGKPADDAAAGHDTLITEDPLDGVQVIKE